MIRQPELMRSGEKVSVKLFQKLNSIGLFKSLKPMPVAVLASKMIAESNKATEDKIKTYKPVDIFN